jgi:hypothetical protein
LVDLAVFHICMELSGVGNIESSYTNLQFSLAAVYAAYWYQFNISGKEANNPQYSGERSPYLCLSSALWPKKYVYQLQGSRGLAVMSFSQHLIGN